MAFLVYGAIVTNMTDLQEKMKIHPSGTCVKRVYLHLFLHYIFKSLHNLYTHLTDFNAF